MKKRALTAVCTAAALLPAIGFTGCGNFNQTNLTQTNEKGEIIAFNGEQQEGGQTFANSINMENKYIFYYFYLGTVYDVPIHTSTIWEFTRETEVSISFSSLTSETLSQSIEKTTQSIDTHSYTGGFEAGVSGKLTAEAGVWFAKVKTEIEAGITTDHHWTNDWGSIATASERTEKEYLHQFSTSYSENVKFTEEAGFKKGYYYRMAVYNNVNAYGVLVYDIANNTYTPVNDFLFDGNDLIRKWEESKDGRFGYRQGKNLSFDINNAIEYAEANKNSIINGTNNIFSNSIFTAMVINGTGKDETTSTIPTTSINSYICDHIIWTTGKYNFDEELRIYRGNFLSFNKIYSWLENKYHQIDDYLQETELELTLGQPFIYFNSSPLYFFGNPLGINITLIDQNNQLYQVSGDQFKKTTASEKWIVEFPKEANGKSIQKIKFGYYQAIDTMPNTYWSFLDNYIPTEKLSDNGEKFIIDTYLAIKRCCDYNINLDKISAYFNSATETLEMLIKEDHNNSILQVYLEKYKLVESILQDGQITKDEQGILHKIINF